MMRVVASILMNGIALLHYLTKLHGGSSYSVMSPNHGRLRARKIKLDNFRGPCKNLLDYAPSKQ
jgi:hypothetical protein